jgi:hypothetical protein
MKTSCAIGSRILGPGPYHPFLRRKRLRKGKNLPPFCPFGVIMKMLAKGFYQLTSYMSSAACSEHVIRLFDKRLTVTVQNPLIGRLSAFKRSRLLHGPQSHGWCSTSGLRQVERPFAVQNHPITGFPERF